MTTLAFTPAQAERCNQRIKYLAGLEPAQVCIADFITLCAMAQVGVELASRDLRMAELATHLSNAAGVDLKAEADGKDSVR